MCSRHWNGKIYRAKQGKCDSDIFAIEFTRREVISATLVDGGRRAFGKCGNVCVFEAINPKHLATRSVIGKTRILPLKALKL